MDYINLDQIFNLHQWTAIGFLFLAAITVAINTVFEPIECTPATLFNYSEMEIRNNCLDESYYKLEYGDQPDITLDTLSYLNEVKDRIEARRIYKLNLTIFPFIMLVGASVFGLMKIHWHFRRTKFKPKMTSRNFIFGQSEQADDEQELLENVKNFISESGKKVKMLFFPFLFLALLMVVKEFMIFSITGGFNANFLFLGLDWLASPFWPTPGFPRRVSCQIVSFRRQQTFTIADYEYTNCELKLNWIYESIYLAAWFWSVFLLGLYVILLFQLFGLMFSKSHRLERTRKLLPFADEPVLIRMAYNKESFFILESLSYDMDRAKFQRIMKLLIDENFYSEKKAIDV